MAKVELHRCLVLSYKGESHGCWQVQKALEGQGMDYELVKSLVLPRSRRKDVVRLTGQQLLPVIEFEDGTAYRREAVDMAASIRAGMLFESRSEGAPAGRGEAAPAEGGGPVPS